MEIGEESEPIEVPSPVHPGDVPVTDPVPQPVPEAVPA